MQIKKRYIKEEIERLEKQIELYPAHKVGFLQSIARLGGRIDALEWVLGFADD